MENKILIDSVNNLKVALNEISVYDFDVYTSMELYYKIAENFNKVIKELNRFEGVVSDEVIKQNEKLLYLLGEGLKIEVVDKINEMVETGVFDTIINLNIFNNLKEDIKNVSSQLEHIVNNIDIFNNDLENDSIRPSKLFKPLKRDKFGFYSIDFIGDSITEGYDSSNHATKSYFALVRNSLLKYHGSSNVGYVNLTNRGFYHNIERVGTWTQTQDYKALGNQSNETNEIGASLKLWVINPQRFFKICYSTAPGMGSFEVYNEESGEILATINCNSEEKYNNISQEFSFSEISSSRLIKIVCKGGNIRINGIWYYDDINKLMVNNYARSGMTLTDTSTQLIDDMTSSSLTFFALNHNDGYSQTYKDKLDIVCNKILSNNGSIFILDFRYSGTIKTDSVKKCLYDKYNEIKNNSLIGSAYLDIGKAFNNDLNIMNNLGFFYDDNSHPYDTGMMMIAQSICEKLNLKLELNLPIYEEWVKIGGVNAPKFQNGHTNYTGYESKFRIKNGVVNIILCLDSARAGSENFIFYIPQMYRPIIDTRVCVQHMDGNRLTMHVGMDGKVYMISDIEQNHRFINFSYSI